MNSDWRTFYLDELCTVSSSKRIFAHDYVESGIPFFSSKDIIDKALGVFKQPSAFISPKRFFDIVNKYSYPQKGDLLLSSVGNRAGIPYVVQCEGEFYFKDGNVTWFKDFKSLDSLFLSYWLVSDVGQRALSAIMIGSAQKALTIAGLSKLRITVPSFDEQVAVVSILKAIDDRISLLRETNATLETIAQALFKSWFVDFDPVRAKQEGREPEGMDAETAALFPDGFEESELGLVPKGWFIGSIGKIAEVIDCLHAKKPELLSEGQPYLQLNNIRNDGLLDRSNLAYISQADYDKWISRIEVREGDCVITNVGRVGAVAQVPTGFRAAIGRNMTAIRLHEGWPYPTYLIELLQSPWMRAEITRRTDIGTILNALNVRNIPALRCVLADKEILSAFEKFCRPIRAGMETNLRRADLLAKMRDTLLPRLISGQLRLPEAEEQFKEALTGT